MNSPIRTLRNSQAGVMLIEALIGILIFSIGILALIGMQATAMKNTTDARYRSEAAFLATQVIGTMWVDIANLAKYDSTYGSAYAGRDTWVTNVAATLPGIDVPNSVLVPAIVVDTATGQVTVTIQWLQPGESQTRTFSVINYIKAST